MRCLFIHKYTEGKASRKLLVTLEDSEVYISDLYSSELLGTFLLEDNSLTGDSTTMPEEVFSYISNKLSVVTARVPIQAGELEEGESGGGSISNGIPPL